MLRSWKILSMTAVLAAALAVPAAQAQPPVARPQPPPAAPNAKAPAAPAKPGTTTPPPVSPQPGAQPRTPPPAARRLPRRLPGLPPPSRRHRRFRVRRARPSSRERATSTSYDAGMGQSYCLYGSTQAFADVVSYYRTALKDRGELVFDAPATHMFEVGRFRESDVAFPPGVTVKDYTWGGSPGYTNPTPGGAPPFFPTVIQIVPPPTAPRK